MPLLPPAQVALALVQRHEATGLDQALGQAQRHGGVVGPLPRAQPEGAAADHVGDRREAARRLELERSAERIADGEAEQRAAHAARLNAVTVRGHGGLLP